MCIGGYFWLDNYVNNTIPREKVIIDASLDKTCDKDFPIYVKILNGSDRTIEKVSFDLVARYPGRSTNVAGFHYYSDDHVLKPLTGFGSCWKAPLDDSHKNEPVASFEWSAKINYINFVKK